MGFLRRKAKSFYANSSIKAKINVFVVGAAAVIFLILIVTITARMKNVVLLNAEKAVVSLGKENAYRTIDFINKKGSALSTLAYCFESQDGMGDLKFDLYNNMIKEQVVAQPDILGIWYKEAFKQGDTNSIQQNIELKKGNENKEALLQKIESKSRYFEVQRTGKMIVSAPFDLNGEWVFCITHPLTLNGSSVGVVGYVVSSKFLTDIVLENSKDNKEFRKIISDDGVIVAHTEAKKIGGPFDEGNQTDEIYGYIKEGKVFEGAAYSSTFGSDAYKVYTPIPFDGTEQAWSFCTAIPIKVMLNAATKIQIFSYFFLLLGILLLVLLINYFSKRLSDPIKEVSDELTTLAEGKLNKVKVVEVRTNDEIGVMKKSLNNLKDNLKQMAIFAKEVGSGNLDVQIDIKSDEDVIGLALMDMQKNLVAAHNAQEIRKKEDEIQNWKINGNARINELVRAQNTSIKMLCDSVLREILSYTNIIQGGVYVLHDDEENEESYLDLASCIAYNRKKADKKRIGVNEGLIGRCLYEKQSILLSEIPDNYLAITSGLGDRNPSYLAIIPLKNNDIVTGVMEFASFKPIDEHILSFLEKAAESLSSTIVSVRTNETTQLLLEKTKEYAEEVGAQEEELRQNMEEMQASQEEMQRKSQDYERTILRLTACLKEHGLDAEASEHAEKINL